MQNQQTIENKKAVVEKRKITNKANDLLGKIFELGIDKLELIKLVIEHK